MTLLSALTWLGDLVALATGLAMLKDILIDRDLERGMWTILRDALRALRQQPAAVTLQALRPVLRFGIRVGLLVLIVAAAGVCVVYPATTTWHGMLLRLALALHMAAQVPCPWLRWILVGDVRAKLNDPPGVERRAQR